MAILLFILLLPILIALAPFIAVYYLLKALVRKIHRKYRARKTPPELEPQVFAATEVNDLIAISVTLDRASKDTTMRVSDIVSDLEEHAEKPEALLEKAAKEGWVERAADDKLTITPDGLRWAKSYRQWMRV